MEQIADPLERQAWETMVRTYGQTPAQLFRAPHPLIQNLGNITLPNQTPQVIEGVNGKYFFVDLQFTLSIVITNINDTQLYIKFIKQLSDIIAGIKWGNYVGAPDNKPVLCWKLKHKTPLASLIPLATGDVFGLSNYTTLLLSYTKEKGH